MADILNGTLVKVICGGVTMALGTSAGFKATMATRETTNKDSLGWSEFQESKMSGTIDFKGFHDESGAYNFSDMFSTLTARTLVTLKFGPTTVGTKYYTAEGYATDVNMTGDVEGNTEISCNFQLTGAITEATNV